MTCDHAPAELRYLADKMAWAMREQALVNATTPADLATLTEMDELIDGVRSENLNHRMFAVDRAWHYLETPNKNPGAIGAQGSLMLRVMAGSYHDVLEAEALAGAATKNGKD